MKIEARVEFTTGDGKLIQYEGVKALASIVTHAGMFLGPNEADSIASKFRAFDASSRAESWRMLVAWFLYHGGNPRTDLTEELAERIVKTFEGVV